MEPPEINIESKISETLIEILKKADMDEMTEFKVRCIASDKLGIDLSVPKLKQFVRNVIESFLISMEEAEEEPVPPTTVATLIAPPPPTPASTEKPPPPSLMGEKEEEKEEKEEEDIKPKIGEKSNDGNGGVIICELSSKRRVTVHDFNGRTLVSIRDFYLKNGKQFPSFKGISLSNEQWSSFRTSVPAIEEAIKKTELRLASGSSSKGECSKVASDYIQNISENGKYS